MTEPHRWPENAENVRMDSGQRPVDQGDLPVLACGPVPTRHFFSLLDGKAEQTLDSRTDGTTRR